VWFLA